MAPTRGRTMCMTRFFRAARDTQKQRGVARQKVNRKREGSKGEETKNKKQKNKKNGLTWHTQHYIHILLSVVLSLSCCFYCYCQPRSTSPYKAAFGICSVSIRGPLLWIPFAFIFFFFSISFSYLFFCLFLILSFLFLTFFFFTFLRLFLDQYKSNCCPSKIRYFWN